MTIRAIEQGDAEIAAQWWTDRGGIQDTTIPPVELPLIGCAAEDDRGPIGFAWLYLPDCGNTAFVEHLIMRPGLQVAEARAAGLAIMHGIEAAARALGFVHLAAYALPACARFLRSAGWNVADERPKIAIRKTLEPLPPCGQPP